MRRVFWLLMILVAVGFASKDPLKIIQSVPYGEKNIKITFNRKISLNDLRESRISSNKKVIDIGAILTIERKNYRFPNGMRVQIAQQNKTTTRILIQENIPYELKPSDNHLYIILKPTTNNSATTRSSKSKQSKSSSLASNAPKLSPRVLGKKIVIDAGHGGRDCGAMGVLKNCEKDVTLKVAKLLESELKKRGYVVYMTRASDFYIGLRERTEFANEKNADLFISIHGNSVPRQSAKGAQGVETYFLSTARSERAKVVAEQENKDDIEAMNFFLKQTFADSIINNPRLVASNKLAIDIQGGILDSLRKAHKVVDGGVREGPFWVLAGALMPSVLIEIGYISHPQEGRKITQRDYQKLLAEGIADGIGGYFAKNP